MSNQYHDNRLFTCQVCGCALDEGDNLDEELCTKHDDSVREDGDPTPLNFDPSGIPLMYGDDIDREDFGDSDEGDFQ